MYYKGKMFYCSFCKEYISIFSYLGMCEFCANLSRIVRLYKKEKVNSILIDSLNINLLEINNEDKPEDKKKTNNIEMLKHEISRLN